MPIRFSTLDFHLMTKIENKNKFYQIFVKIQ